jgi:uncharacterized protein
MVIKQRTTEQKLREELKRVTDIVIREYAPEKIFLFGSLAGGAVHEESDIDLAVIKKTDEKFIRRMRALRLLTRPREAVDFIVYTPEEFEAMRVEGRRFLVEEILGKGEVLYEKSE